MNLIRKLICTKRNYVLFTFCQLSFNPSFVRLGLFTIQHACVHCTRGTEERGWDVGEQECYAGGKRESFFQQGHCLKHMGNYCPPTGNLNSKKKAFSQICWHTSLANAGCISHSVLEAVVSSVW